MPGAALKSVPQQLPLWSVKQRKGKIDPKPPYQRGAVWTTEKKQLLIDSILRGYDIPKVYLRRLKEDATFDFEVVDGQQRLRAIWDFMDEHYPLGPESIDFDKMPDLSGKYFSELTSEQQDIIGSFPLTITSLEDASDIEVRELFLRLQEGVSLKPPEKRNAIPGKMRDFIEEISSEPIFIKTTAKNDRFQHADYAAHVTALELKGGPVEIKAADLKKMYETEGNFDSSGIKAKKIRRTLNYMNQVFDELCPSLKIKWGFVDLYWLISQCLEGYDISNRHKDFYSFFMSFETERAQIEDPATLLAEGHTQSQKDMYDYIQAFQKEGATRTSLETRANVYLRRFLEEFPDLKPKDSRRVFNENERLVIWRRAFMKCQSCGISLRSLADMHADHIVPHSKGGQTTVENAQSLCAPCNLTKGNRTPG